MRNYIVILLTAILFTACAEKVVAPAITNTKWTLTEWPGKAIPAVAPATLEFKEGNNVAGKSFCNGYGGSYVLTGDQLKFGPLFGTKMYCEAVGSAETEFLRDMDKVTAVKVAGTKLQLLQGDKVLLIFTRE